MARRTLKRMLRATLVGGLLLAGTVALPATPANATINPGNCIGAYPDGERWWAYCAGTAPSTFRAKATCRRVGGGSAYTIYGPWRLPNNYSYTPYCQGGYEIESGTWELHQ